MIKEENGILLSLILRILVAIILGLGGSAYVMLVPNPKYPIVVCSYLIATILAGWVIADVIQNKNT